MPSHGEDLFLETNNFKAIILGQLLRARNFFFEDRFFRDISTKFVVLRPPNLTLPVAFGPRAASFTALIYAKFKLTTL